MLKRSITLKALIARINRRLHHNNEILRTSRGERDLNRLGKFFIVDLNRNVITVEHVDPVLLGEQLGVIKDDEQVEEAEQGRRYH